MPSSDKTEQATPKRRQEARKRGQVARSVEISAAAVLLVSFVILQAFGGQMVEQLRVLMKQMFQVGALTAGNENGYGTYGSMATSTFFNAMTPLLFGLLATGLAVNLAQTKLLFSLSSLKPKLSMLNPLSGLKRMFSMQALFQLFKALAKMAICGFVGYQIVSEKYSSFLPLENASVAASWGFVASVAMELCFKVGGVLLALAAVDYLYQRHTFESNLKMSVQEVKEETRSTEGDPQLKARIKRQQRLISKRRMMQKVPTADVVVTNPTHFAVALKYDPTVGDAPIVVAKGQDLIAEQIKKIARENKVPVVENKPLAQALFKMVEIGDQIPSSLYLAVAEVLAFIYQLKRPGMRPANA